jgi:single-strand DNA-binding protein
VNLNRVELMGGLTRDPEIRQAKNGQSFLEVTLAVNGTRYDREAGGQVVTSTFVTVMMFGPPADMVGELSRGDEVYVLGELGQREVDKPGGGTEKRTRVYASVCWPTRVRARNGAPVGAEAWQ